MPCEVVPLRFVFFKMAAVETVAKFVQPIPTILAYLVPLDVDVVSYQVSSISVWRVTC
jgi:hypothetical protein